MQRSPTPFLLFLILLLSLSFLPRGRQMLSQLGLTYPLAGGLAFNPELEELTQDHQLP